MREHYINQLRQVQDDLVRMGSRVEHALTNAVRALERWDTDLAHQVIAGDGEIDEARASIDEAVQDLIATQQPVARDLRILLATIAISAELERAGDYAKGVAKKVELCLQAPILIEVPQELHRLGTLAQTMLHTSLDSFVQLDVTLARSLAEQDEQIDALEDQVIELLHDKIREDIRALKSATYLLDVAHVLERTADRATNIAERVIYIATASVEELNP
ncbi:MAG TPA: phosphate signaling complex protein PhoU [Roseiflexaceae bacterium]|nr:phosphate signaling complex protein PhoU [Roseiflexaceae bacterium]HMP42933.1 phosphate signaling complex protein PhoU [Roseiflexaceae bacterium]